MKTYKMDVQLWATLYVKAQNEDEARANLMEIVEGETFELCGRDISIDDDSFMSAAVTFTGKHSDIDCFDDEEERDEPDPDLQREDRDERRRLESEEA